jgi:hypothetical protein
MLTTESLLRYLADLASRGGTLTAIAAMLTGVLACWLFARRAPSSDRSGGRRSPRRDVRRRNSPLPLERARRPRRSPKRADRDRA